MKLKTLFSSMALAIGAVGSAQAAIMGGETGNGELFFSVYDPVADVSYVQDLGIRLDDFLTLGNTPGYNLNVALQPLFFSTFLPQVTQANLLWNVAALDSTGSGAGGERYLSTSNTALSTIKNQTNTNLTAFDLVNNYVNSNNGLATDSNGDLIVDSTHGGPSRNGDGTESANVALNGASVATATNGFGYFETGFGTNGNWSTKATFSSVAAVGTPLNFYYLTPSSTAGLSKATVSQFGTTFSDLSFHAAQFQLTHNGTSGALTYSVAQEVSAVPVPAAVWLFGSGITGLVGIARRRHSV